MSGKFSTNIYYVEMVLDKIFIFVGYLLDKKKCLASIIPTKKYGNRYRYRYRFILVHNSHRGHHWEVNIQIVIVTEIKKNIISVTHYMLRVSCHLVTRDCQSEKCFLILNDPNLQ